MIPSTAKLPDQLAAPLASYWERKNHGVASSPTSFVHGVHLELGIPAKTHPGIPEMLDVVCYRDMNMKSGVRNSTNL